MVLKNGEASPYTATSSNPGHLDAQYSRARFQMLDGWRAISIFLVLAAHMLPLGPKAWALNENVAALGMAIFFALSGFLIVNMFLKDQNVLSFIIKRVTRIVPLAWLVIFLVLIFKGASRSEWTANLLFFANLPPFYLNFTGHFWSLGVEMQFYVCIASVIVIFGRQGLFLVPVIAFLVTSIRIVTGTEISIVTWLRVDEILAGGIVALIIHGSRSSLAFKLLSLSPFYPVAVLFIGSANSQLEVLNYGRPYLSAAMIGITIVRPVIWLTPLLISRGAAYIAKVSYAVYVIHPYSMMGWLGSGTGLDKYLKRPICFVITFGLAHLSTFRFERPINDWAHQLADRPRFRRAAASQAGALTDTDGSA